MATKTPLAGEELGHFDGGEFESFGSRLEQFIREVYTSREKFQEMTGFSKQQLSDYILNKKQPKFPQMLRMHNAGMSLTWGIGGIGPMAWAGLVEKPESSATAAMNEAWADEVIAAGKMLIRLGTEAKGNKNKDGTTENNRTVGE
jgi:hypothetical protein